MIEKTHRFVIFLLVLFFVSCGVTNIFAARYYRLLEKERKIFLGLRGIDSLAAVGYLHLESTAERALYYETFWQDKSLDDRREFEERIEYAFNEYGKHAPLSDDRIPIFVKYGEPSIREVITPQKRIAIKIKEDVKPAEVWKYNSEGKIFDFVRFMRAYELVATSEFGGNVRIPYLEEVEQDTSIDTPANGVLTFSISLGRYRQKKNLTRLEVYIANEINDTTDCLYSRNIQVFDADGDSIIQTQSDILKPREQTQGLFIDEVNFWLEPKHYRLEIKVSNVTTGATGKQTILVSLVDYQDDAKEISDLIPAKLIDDAFTHRKFEKPVGRVIPLVQPIVPVHTPFYFYAEVYNLETKFGEHQIKTTYEVYNKEKMRKEIVDTMIKSQIDIGNVAYIAAEYHPMDLSPGHYLVVLRVEDMLTGKERTAVSEFELVEQIGD